MIGNPGEIKQYLPGASAASDFRHDGRVDRDNQDREHRPDQQRAFRNYMLFMAAGTLVLILGYFLIALGYWPMALVLGAVCAIGIRPLRKRLGID